MCSKYESWTLVELKNELKKRGFKSTGKKKALFER
jgi:hypothetical protein